VVGVAGLAAVTVGAVVACEPGDMNSMTAAYTTQQTATAELNREHAGVRWLSCTGGYGSGARAGTASTAGTASGVPSPTATAVVSVDCQGRTKDGRRITVTGKVTRAVDGACVRGDLIARVGGKQWFRLDGLGDCNARPSATYSPPPSYRPPSGQLPGPTVTVTVTRTLWCKGDPTCWPVEGK
jgi:hypothetical protein